MRKLALLLVGLGLVPVLVVGVSMAKQEPNIRFIMQRKLDHAHSLLEALVTEDFETLEDSAGALRALSEESGWFVMMTPEYTERSTAFRRSVMEIEASAKEKNLDRAALGYVDMTLQCVRCHQFLRGTARADLNGLLLPRNYRHTARLGHYAQEEGRRDPIGALRSGKR